MAPPDPGSTSARREFPPRPLPRGRLGQAGGGQPPRPARHRPDEPADLGEHRDRHDGGDAQTRARWQGYHSLLVTVALREHPDLLGLDLLPVLVPAIHSAACWTDHGAISRWLEEEHELRFSPATLRRALSANAAADAWHVLWRLHLRTATDALARAHRLRRSVELLEGDGSILDVLRDAEVHLSLGGPEQSRAALEALRQARTTLRQRWFILEPRTRTCALKYLTAVLAQTDEDRLDVTFVPRRCPPLAPAIPSHRHRPHPTHPTMNPRPQRSNPRPSSTPAAAPPRRRGRSSPRGVSPQPPPDPHPDRGASAGTTWAEVHAHHTDLLRERVDIHRGQSEGAGAESNPFVQIFSVVHSASRWLTDAEISHWLLADGGMDLPAVRVRAALDRAATYWPHLWQDLRFIVLPLARCYNVGAEALLFTPDVFASLPGWQPGEPVQGPEDYQRHLLARWWFGLGAHTRQAAHPHLRAALATLPGPAGRPS